MSDNDDLTRMIQNIKREPKCDPQTYRELMQMLRFWEKKFPVEFREAMAKIVVDKRETA